MIWEETNFSYWKRCENQNLLPWGKVSRITLSSCPGNT